MFPYLSSTDLAVSLVVPPNPLAQMHTGVWATEVKNDKQIDQINNVFVIKFIRINDLNLIVNIQM